MKKKLLLSLMVFAIFFLIPFSSVGAVWSQGVGLLSDAAVVFGSDQPAVDRYMAAALKAVYGNRIGIGTGTAATDTAVIRAAHASCNTTGGGSVLLRGAFTLAASGTGSVIDVSTNMTLRGLAPELTVLTLSSNVTENVIGSSSTSNITIESLTVDGNKYYNIEGGVAADGTQNGVYLSGVTGARISNVVSRNNVFHGYHIYNSTYVTIEKSKASINRFRGVINQKSSSDNTFRDLVLSLNGDPNNYNQGTYGSATNGGIAVAIGGNRNLADHVTVINDRGTATGAIDMGATFPGDSATTSTGNRVQNCIVAGGTTGIRLWGSTGGSLVDTWITNNYVEDGVGLLLDTLTATGLYVRGNSFISDYTNAISYVGTCAITRSDVSSNRMYANGGDNVAEFYGFIRSTFTNNKLSGSGNVPGMSFVACGWQNDISGNFFFSVTSAIITDSNTTAVVHGNVGQAVGSDPGMTLGGTITVYRNTGVNYVTENSGSFTILAGTTSTNITHGLSYTPAIGDITVTTNAAMGSASYLYVDTIGATIFIIHANTDPVTANVTGGWNVKK